MDDVGNRVMLVMDGFNPVVIVIEGNQKVK